MEVKRRSQDPIRPGLDSRGPRHAESFQATLFEVVEQSAARFGDRVFLRRRHSRSDETVTFAQLAADVRRTAAGLAASGIAHGDRVGLMSEGRYEWMLADLGSAAIGAVVVPRGADTAPAEMEFILRHSACRSVFVENSRLAQEISRAADALPDLEAICSLERECDVPGVGSMSDLLSRGDEWLSANPLGVDELAARVRPDDLLTIVYTSGTTADPKGVMLTHGNVLSNARTSNLVLGFGEDDCFLSVLPPWHMYERMMDYLALAVGSELVYTDRRIVKEDLAKVSPTVFAAVPRFWESIHDALMNKCEKLPPRKRSLMRFALETCRRVGSGRKTLLDRIVHPILERTLIKRFRTVTGGRLRVAVSGGGALPAHVDQCLIGLGLPILNGYGLTETSPVVSVRTPDDNRWGTIGPPLPETEVEIRDEQGRVVPRGETGLIWIRGPGVMKGYYRNPDRTLEVLQDGWFNSGDLGTIEPDGHIRITGRAKDTIVLAGGENVEPTRIESAVLVSPYIEQAVVFGQDRKSLGALLVVAADSLEQRIPRARWGIENGLATADDVVQLIRSEINRLLTRERGFRSIERIATFRLTIEPMTPENGFLTPTMKIKRHVVMERHGSTIDEMFSS